MPHIIVEYSDNLKIDVPGLLRALHEELAAEPSVEKARIKTRATPLQHYVVGEDSDADGMLHITIKVLPRPEDVRAEMTLSLQKIAKAALNEMHPNCKLTVEAMTLDAHSYCA